MGELIVAGNRDPMRPSEIQLHSDGFPLATVHWYRSEEETSANAARLVACWNAFAGVPTSQIPNAKIREILAAERSLATVTALAVRVCAEAESYVAIGFDHGNESAKLMAAVAELRVALASLGPRQPCPGKGTCCNRPEFDRTVAPCDQEQYLRRRVGELERAIAAVEGQRDALRDALSEVRATLAVVASVATMKPNALDAMRTLDRAVALATKGE